MSLFCRIGVHRWAFKSQFLDEPGRRSRTEIVRARCKREGCARYGNWGLVHREVHVNVSTTQAAPARIGFRGYHTG